MIWYRQGSSKRKIIEYISILDKYGQKNNLINNFQGYVFHNHVTNNKLGCQEISCMNMAIKFALVTFIVSVAWLDLQWHVVDNLKNFNSYINYEDLAQFS